MQAQTHIQVNVSNPLPHLPQAQPDKKRHASANIDCHLHELSSFKLLSVLRLNTIEGCELEPEFIAEIKTELQRRGDSQVWQQPH